jgi:hypothetical protein
MVTQPDPLPENDGETSGSQQQKPDVSRELDDLRDYKRILNEGLKNLPKEAIPDNIKDDHIKNMETLQGDLHYKIEDNIKRPKYKSAREKYKISADAVAINANNARVKLSIIISSVNRCKAAGTSPDDLEKYIIVIHNSLDECRDALQNALAQFSQIKRLSSKSK